MTDLPCWRIPKTSHKIYFTIIIKDNDQSDYNIPSLPVIFGLKRASESRGLSSVKMMCKLPAINENVRFTNVEM
jgi:hypothetical protein